MRRAASLRGALLAALLAAATPLAAQEHRDSLPANPATTGGAAAPQVTGHGEAQQAERVDIITPHITDAYDLELPYWKPPFYKHVCLGRHVGEHGCGPLWDPVHVGGLSVNLSPTKHVVMLLVAALLCCAVLISAAVAHRRHSHEVGRPKGFAAGIEAMILYIRNEVAVPNLGHHGEGYVPFILTLFFFILFANLLGLIPYGSTATGNIAVTATLAIITFLVIEVAGMRANGLGYLNTIFYWNKDLPMYMRIPMAALMTPVEIIGKFTKPFALAIRLFANMTAGHIVVLAFIGLFFGFAASGGLGSLTAVAPFLMAVAIMLLELFVAFLQAFIFSLLASVFIGQIREAHH